MTNYKNNLPPYAEEVIINQEREQIQQILNQFKHLVPEGFTELGQPKKYWGSTEDLKEPVCERYSFKHDGKLITLDIDKELSDKLKLTPKDNFCIDKKILPSDLLEEGIITIRNEKEIFLKKSFTIENLEEDIKNYYDKIKELKDKKDELVKKNEKQAEELTRKDDRIKQLEEIERQKKEEIKRYDTRLSEVLKTEKEIFNLLGNHSNKGNSIERVNDLIQRLNKVSETNNKVANFLNFNENQLKKVVAEIKEVSHIPVLSYLLEEYRKEKFWWDKWIKEKQPLFTEEGRIIWSSLINSDFYSSAMEMNFPKDLKDEVRYFSHYIENIGTGFPIKLKGLVYDYYRDK